MKLRGVHAVAMAVQSLQQTRRAARTADVVNVRVRVGGTGGEQNARACQPQRKSGRKNSFRQTSEIATTKNHPQRKKNKYIMKHKKSIVRAALARDDRLSDMPMPMAQWSPRSPPAPPSEGAEPGGRQLLLPW
jgi:hypothetical protein